MVSRLGNYVNFAVWFYLLPTAARGVEMPTEAAKKRQAKKKAKAQASKQGTSGVSKSEATSSGSKQLQDGGSSLAGAVGGIKLSARSVTGVLSSHSASRDVHIDRFSLTFHGVELLSDTRLELNCGRRYGLLGLNGCGKCLIT